MAKKHLVVLSVMLLLFALVLSGCSGGQASATVDEPTDMMAWQFAQGLVRPRVPRPSHATFPRYQSSFVERTDDATFRVTSYVNTLDSEGALLTYYFTVTANYLGNDVFEETAVELRKN